MEAFTKLPGPFDRNFVIGFLLPAIVLLSAIWFIAGAFGRLPNWVAAKSVKDLSDTIVIAAIAWLTAIALLALNRSIVRTMEGYTFERLWGLSLLKRCRKERFKRKALPPMKVQQTIDEARSRGEADPEITQDHADKLRNAIEEFPHDAEYILPTKFGNRYRAIEVYSKVVYGLDAIPAWGRLQAIIPKEFRESISDARSQLDFSINIEFSGIIGLALYFVFAVDTRSFPSYWIPILLFALFLFGYMSSLSSLSQYGLYVKSAFDLYRKDLAAQLGLDLPRSSSAEREMWTDVSRMMIYRSPFAWDRLLKHRIRGGKDI